MVNHPLSQSINRPNIAKVKVLIADDHPLLRQALRSEIEKEPDFEIVGEAGNGEEAIKLTSERFPDVIIMDIAMPVMNGVEATKHIKTQYPRIPILILTVHTDTESIFGILQAGASGYLTKASFSNEIIPTLRALMAGETVLCQAVTKEVLKYALQYITKPVRLEEGGKITGKQVEILRLATHGLSNKEIGLKLGISESTVKAYLGEIFAKMNVFSRTEAIYKGLKMGILTLDDLG
jgi:DNA-binding NarL/FixJ family response regulator